MRAKSTKEIEEFKKVQDRLVVEKAQLWYHKVQLENVISQVCEWVAEAAMDEDVEAKVQWLGIIITQLERDIKILNYLVHLDT